MKLHRPNQNKRGMTLTEVLVVLVMLVLLASIVIPGSPSRTQRFKAQRINCVSNLKQIGLAMKVWEGDNGDKFPMAYCATNDEEMKLVANGHAFLLFQTLSNSLGSPKVLLCPADEERTAARNLAALANTNISYFLNLDASDMYPAMFLSGDDNLLINDKPVQPGLLTLKNGDSLSWANTRHKRVGNIGLSDGSVMQLTTMTLRMAFTNSFAGTNALVINRLVIP